MTRPDAGVEQTRAADLLSAEHAHGFSSLSLLTGSEEPARVLYLLDWSRAILTGRGGERRSRTIVVDGWQALPIGTHAFDAAVVDSDAVPEGDAIRRAVANELRRIVQPAGRCVMVAAHRRRPRDRREWRRYRLIPPAERWRDVLADAGFALESTASLKFDGRRITEIQLEQRAIDRNPAAAEGDAVALVHSAQTADFRPLLEVIWQAVERFGHVVERPSQVHVRKIGKTTAFLAAGGNRCVIRLPCSPVAVARAQRNHEALLALRESSERPAIPLELVPRPVGAGSVAGQQFFVETCVPGAPRESPVSRPTWEPQALEFITNLHASTARPHVLSDEWFEQTVDPALADIGRCCASLTGPATWDWLRVMLRSQLSGRLVPLVRSHGDFTGSNCLYDARGRLTGVVDWELSAGDALPLLDLLQCVDLASEYAADGRWCRADLVFDAIERRGPLHDAPEIDAYVKRLELSREMLPALLVLYWIDHVGARVRARHSDERWLFGRVAAPLMRLPRLSNV